MHVTLLLTCVTLVNCVPCRPRNPEAFTKENEGNHYYFHTTTAATVRFEDTQATRPVSFKTITPRGKICKPYQFNETICEYVGDRELCGYNMNPEVVAAKSKIKSTYLSNGCWLRKGRVECGYKEPFSNVQRPPIQYPRLYVGENDQSTIHMIKQRDKLVVRTTTTTTTTTTEFPTTIYQECVEIHSRIVCRTTRQRVIV